jgi:hypothetical protein
VFTNPQPYKDDDEQYMMEDIVARYAHESLVEDVKKDEDELLLIQVILIAFLPGALSFHDADYEQCQVEHMKRELAMFHAAQVVHKQLLAMDEQLDRMALAVLPPEERLPKPVHFGGKAKHEALSNQIRGLLRCVFMSSDSTDAFRHF